MPFGLLTMIANCPGQGIAKYGYSRSWQLAILRALVGYRGSQAGKKVLATILATCPLVASLYQRK